MQVQLNALLGEAFGQRTCTGISWWLQNINGVQMRFKSFDAALPELGLLAKN